MNSVRPQFGAWWASRLAGGVGWFLLLLLGSTTGARADGGRVVLQEVQSPVRVTVMMDPAEARVGWIDLSVLVQSAEGTEVWLDAETEFLLHPPKGAVLPAMDPFCGPNGEAMSQARRAATSPVRRSVATRATATNRLLRAARIHFPVAGEWLLEVRVRRADARARFEAPLSVLEPPMARASVVGCLALPPLVIGLYITHQGLRRRMTSSS
jgi:hypothetical protein